MKKIHNESLAKLRKTAAAIFGFITAMPLNSSNASATVFDILEKSYVSQSDWVESALGFFFVLIFVTTHFRFCKKISNQSVASKQQTSANFCELKSEKMINTTIAHRMKFAIIDDDIFIRESWELFMQDFNIHTFDSPETFLLASERSSGFLATFDAIIVDYDFGVKSSMSGTELAQILRRKTAIPIILSTDRDPKDISEIEKFDLHLNKNILDWHGLQKLLPAVIS